MGHDQAAGEAEPIRRAAAPDSARRSDDERSGGGARLALAASIIAVSVALLALASWHLRQLLILTFIAILLAILFTALGDRLHGLTGLPKRWATLIAGLAVALAIGAALTFFLPTLGEQVGQLLQRLPEILGQLRQQLGGIPWMSKLIDQLQAMGQPEGAPASPGGILSGAQTALATASGVAGSLIYVLFAAAFFALQPTLYRDGFLRLLPRSRRVDACDILDEMGRTLRSWLRAQLLIMAVVGVATGLGLWAIGVPLPFVLGVTAGLLDAIPYIGPIMAAVPAVLLALSEGTTTALWTVALFVVVQQLEGNLLEPVVQRQAVSTPPVLVLFAIFAMGTLFGILGALIATPAVALALILVRRLYVEPVADRG